ncbi:Sir2 histone deacetylase Hst2 [Malassezia brasiliensis]|uniref:Sir2 histone deacetylase Hst2 n=1 Tax=Malassezia brasiliensis TaxID=1821822 RepID=A0AAF0DS34_9BASI|nr:Sir2 histone deacetylase Hst2 [Malassezia brasiliensis]
MGMVASKKPSVSPVVEAQLEELAKLLTNAKVDTLELLGGLSPDMLVEAHGSFAKARCIECKTEVDDDWLKEKVMSGSVARCEQPKCQKKDQVPSIKPDIVCTYLFNLDRVGESRSGGFLSRLDPFGGGGFDFSEDSRDVFCQGKVDDTIRVLAQKCGWEEELDSLYNEFHVQSNSESADQESAKDSTSPSTGDLDKSTSDATDALAEQLKATKLDVRTDAKSEKL